MKHLIEFQFEMISKKMGKSDYIKDAKIWYNFDFQYLKEFIYQLLTTAIHMCIDAHDSALLKRRIKFERMEELP